MGPQGGRLGLLLGPPLARAWHPLPLRNTESFPQGLRHPAVSQALQQRTGLRREVSPALSNRICCKDGNVPCVVFKMAGTATCGY